MEKLYKMGLDFDRQGFIEGVFIADSEQVRMLINQKIEVNFGEVLGKHSDISTTIEDNDITELTSLPEVIEIVRTHGLENGYNPFFETAKDFEHPLVEKHENIYDLTTQLLILEENGKL